MRDLFDTRRVAFHGDNDGQWRFYQGFLRSELRRIQNFGILATFSHRHADSVFSWIFQLMTNPPNGIYWSRDFVQVVANW